MSIHNKARRAARADDPVPNSRPVRRTGHMAGEAHAQQAGAGPVEARQDREPVLPGLGIGYTFDRVSTVIPQIALPGGEPIGRLDSEIRWFEPVAVAFGSAGAPPSSPGRSVRWCDVRWVGFAGGPDAAAWPVPATARLEEVNRRPAGSDGAASEGLSGAEKSAAELADDLAHAPEAEGPVPLARYPHEHRAGAVPQGGRAVALHPLLATQRRLRQHGINRSLRFGAVGALATVVAVCTYAADDHMPARVAMRPAVAPVGQAAAVAAPQRHRQQALASGDPFQGAAHDLDRADARVMLIALPTFAKADPGIGWKTGPARFEAVRPKTGPSDLGPAGRVVEQRGIASWYGAAWRRRLTASGKRFDGRLLTAASRSLPFWTRAHVTNLRNGRSVDVVVNDRGPYRRGRIIDLSAAAAAVLGMTQSGIARVAISLPRVRRKPAS